MPKLNDVQLIVLSHANARDNRVVLPLPKSLKLKNEEITKLLQGLSRRRLIIERSATEHEPIWREKAGKPVTLVITDAGLNAIGVDPQETESIKEIKAKKSEEAAAPAAPITNGASKQKVVIALLERQEGATIEEMMRATNWQRHSLRGMMSGVLRKRLGLNLTLDNDEKRGHVYRIIGTACEAA